MFFYNLGELIGGVLRARGPNGPELRYEADFLSAPKDPASTYFHALMIYSFEAILQSSCMSLGQIAIKAIKLICNDRH